MPKAMWWCPFALLVLTGCNGDESSNVALGTLERDRLELPAEAHEPVIEILASEGEHVTEGQVLLRLDSMNGAAQVASLKAQANGAQHRLDELIRGPRAEDILEARARLAGADAQLESESKEYERVRELVQRKLTSQSSLDRQRLQQRRAGRPGTLPAAGRGRAGSGPKRRRRGNPPPCGMRIWAGARAINSIHFRPCRCCAGKRRLPLPSI